MQLLQCDPWVDCHTWTSMPELAKARRYSGGAEKNFTAVKPDSWSQMRFVGNSKDFCHKAL